MKLEEVRSSILKLIERESKESSFFSKKVNVFANVEGTVLPAIRTIGNEKSKKVYIFVDDKKGQRGAFNEGLLSRLLGEEVMPVNGSIIDFRKWAVKKNTYDDCEVFVAEKYDKKYQTMFMVAPSKPFVDKIVGDSIQLLFEASQKPQSDLKKLDENDVSEIAGIENDNDINFKPDIAWIRRMYNEMNRKLFDYRLGHCDFDIFKKGAGSQGHVLGFFTFGRGVRMNRLNRHMFVVEASGNIQYINYENFPLICRPRIELNGNYHGKQSSFLNTLVHEMCHYWTYMNGFSPSDAHGAEFMRAARMVQENSGGTMEIGKVASAEEMEGYQLDQNIADRNMKRTQTRQSRSYLVIVVQNKNTVYMSMISSLSVVEKIVDYYREMKSVNMILVSKDSGLMQYLFDKHYGKIFRSWRYWDISSRPWLPEFLNMMHQGIKDMKVDIVHHSGVEMTEAGSDNSIEIKPGMNLSLKSPLEN